MTSDVLIIGGGVIGLSLAYELSNRGRQVHLVDAAEPGREASWAGGGILPPANPDTAVDPLDKLRGISHQLHPLWAQRLKTLTGIDNEYECCGGIYLARQQGEAAALSGLLSTLPTEGIAVEKLNDQQLQELEPTLSARRFAAAYLLPDEALVRNPRHLQALLAACQINGVQITPNCKVTDILVQNQQAQQVETTTGPFTAKQICMTAGAWTTHLLQGLGIPNGILPIRGQMILYQAEPNLLRHVLNEGSRYVIPRQDGHLLVGSCEEEVGFVKGTTSEMIAQLAEFAGELVPALKELDIKQSWSGLRPASFDGMPYLGRIPNIANLFIAAGHFRSGLHLSTGTAVVMADLMTAKTPEIDMSHFSILRQAQVHG
ncbi:MAG: glycine oxidase ThiO [Planctomycetota bacterium]|nr:glycine oxidase ThiO [Planctomycetota bacterium]